MELDKTKKEYMDDQLIFEAALHRVKNRLKDEGKHHTFADLLDLAKAEVEREYEQNVALAASFHEKP